MTLNNKTKEIIVRETTKLIQKNGYSGTSIQDIIKTSKAPKGSMYYYFPKGKDDIIISSLEVIDADYKKQFKVSVANSQKLEDILLAIVRLFKSQEKSHGTPSFRLTLLALETIGLAPAVAEKCSKMLLDWKQMVSEAIEELGINCKTSEQISEWFFTTIQGSICASIIYQNNEYYMGVAERSIKLIANSDHETLTKMFAEN